MPQSARRCYPNSLIQRTRAATLARIEQSRDTTPGAAGKRKSCREDPGLGRAMGLFRIVRKSGMGIVSTGGSSRKKEADGRMCGFGEILDLLERRPYRSILPSSNLRKPMRERVNLQARTLTRPTQ